MIEIEDQKPTPSSSHLRQKPPKTGYRVSGVPKRYQDQVQLSAVLRPYYGKLRNDADIANTTGWVLHYWRRRAEQLAVAGCKPFFGEGEEARLPNALGCRVSFVLTYGGKKSTPCGMPTVCPFCWAREVRQYWMRIDKAFFPPAPGAGKRRVRMVDIGHEQKKSSSFTHSVKDGEPVAKSQFNLIQRIYTFQLPAIHRVPGPLGPTGHSDVTMHGLTAWLKSRTRGWPYPQLHRLPECRNILKAAGPGSGLLEAIHFRRIAADDHGQRETTPVWEVQIRQVILSNPGTMPPTPQFHSMVKPSYSFTIENPKRKRVVSAVARALHYPNDIIDLRVPVDRIVEYLNLRREFRLIATYGRFRSSKI